MEKSKQYEIASGGSPRAVIFSHPRSGLHLLRCGLYLIEGGTESYEQFWPNYDILYAHHVPWDPVFSSDEFVQMYAAAGVKVILLIRNFHELIPKTVYPMILNTYVNLAPDKLRTIHSDVNIKRAMDKTLTDEERFGSFGFESKTYLKLIEFYDGLPSTIEKSIIHYEDLIQDNSTLLRAADFVGIQYQKEQLDIEKIKQKTKQLYVKSSHFPSPPEGALMGSSVHQGVELFYHQELDHKLYDKYLKRYEGQYK